MFTCFLTNQNQMSSLVWLCVGLACCWMGQIDGCVTGVRLRVLLTNYLSLLRSMNHYYFIGYIDVVNKRSNHMD